MELTGALSAILTLVALEVILSADNASSWGLSSKSSPRT